MFVYVKDKNISEVKALETQFIQRDQNQDLLFRRPDLRKLIQANKKSSKGILQVETSPNAAVLLLTSNSKTVFSFSQL